MAIDNNKSNFGSGTGMSSSSTSGTTLGSSTSQSGMSSSASGFGAQTPEWSQGSEIGTESATSQSRVQGANLGQQSGKAMSGHQAVDNVPDAIGQVIDSIFRAIQPRVHEAVTSFANRAVGNVSDMSPRQLVTTARRNPWYTVGGVALLVVGLGVILGLENRRGLSPHELH